MTELQQLGNLLNELGFNPYPNLTMYSRQNGIKDIIIWKRSTHMIAWDCDHYSELGVMRILDYGAWGGIAVFYSITDLILGLKQNKFLAMDPKVSETLQNFKVSENNNKITKPDNNQMLANLSTFEKLMKMLKLTPYPKFPFNRATELKNMIIWKKADCTIIWDIDHYVEVGKLRILIFNGDVIVIYSLNDLLTQLENIPYLIKKHTREGLKQIIRKVLLEDLISNIQRNDDGGNSK
jgi:hypothetical protein